MPLWVPLRDENSVQHAHDIRIEDWSIFVEGKRPNGARGIASNTLERQQFVVVAGQFACVTLDRLARNTMEPFGPDVVSQWIPEFLNVFHGCRGQCFETRIAIQELVVFWDDAIHLSLLQHDL